MDKFNNIMSALAVASGVQPKESDSTEQNCDGIPDTDSNVGEVGKINDETTDDMIILHIGGGIELKLPMTVIKQIISASSTENTECSEE